MKYAWVQQHRDLYPINRMCQVLSVSTSGFYKRRNAQPSARALRSARIRTAVKQIYDRSNRIYGSYKIAHQLKTHDQLESACRNTAAKAMRELGLKSRVSSKFKPATTITDPDKKPAANLLDQQFQAKAPNQKWVADITYLPTKAGWVYLAVMIDLFSRKVVGWKLSDRFTTPLVTGALRQAIENRKPKTNGLIHHSDRGCQYTSDWFQRITRTMNINCSMSRTGCCYDNAVAERFFWSLKHEWTKFEKFNDIKDTQLSVFKYIETFYSNE